MGGARRGRWRALGLGLFALSLGAASAEAPALRPLSWEELGGFPYPAPSSEELATPEALRARQQRMLPERVRALDGARVEITGFLVPAELAADGRITRIILMASRDAECCFGAGIGIQQWIEVEVLEPGGIQAEAFQPLRVRGPLSVGEQVKAGVVTSLYRLRAESCEAPE